MQKQLTPIKILEQWARQQKDRWLHEIDFQENGKSYYDLIWVGCRAIAEVVDNEVHFLRKVNLDLMQGKCHLGDPEFFDWFDSKLIEAGLFKI